MTVEEMLARISSSELTEWQAYEKEYGLLGPQWDREVLRQIHYFLQALAMHQTQQKNMEPRMFPDSTELFKAIDTEDWVPLQEDEE